MIETVSTLEPREHRAVTMLLARIVEPGRPRLLRTLLFGSKARGDFDENSDVDLLLVYDLHPDDRDALAAAVNREAHRVAAATGVAIEPWAIPAADLEAGRRTPMLVDALDDGRPLWPIGAPPLRLPFTPADARFCASCLADWVLAGGPIVRRALEEGRRDDAALRARDDITRLATAALLLTGDTRHRRRGSLLRFEERFVGRRLVSPRVRSALDWAAAGFPADGGRGVQQPPPTPAATASAELGFDLAAVMETEVLPRVLRQIGRG